MAKVGILSMQRIINYGSFLQSYGLKKMIEDLGHEVCFVDFRVEKPLIRRNEKTDISFFQSKINKTLKVLQCDAPFLQRLQYIMHKKKFAKKYFSFLGIKSEMNYTPELDILIIGSDEVFNCVQENLNVGYSLELFGKNNRAKKVISYAASFGNTTVEKLQQYGKKDEIGVLLQKIDAISVRDSNSSYIIECLTDKVPQYHLDPVLIYDFINKCQVIPNIKFKEKFLILYAYAGRISQEEAKWIHNYAQNHDLKIYAIGGVQKYSDRFIDCSPFEVLAYFQNAEFVITDTFHGTIFSIITKRRFATVIRKSEGIKYGNEEKITDLMSRMGLDSQTTTDIEEVEQILKKNINYRLIEQLLENERSRSMAYLAEQILEKKN